MGKTVKYEGSCHCGHIAYEVEGDIDSLMECNCSICTRRGYLLWFTSRDKLNLKTPEDAMATYSFGEHKIQHNFCPACGCAPLGFGKDEKGNEMVAINARCMHNIDLGKFKINYHDGLSA